MVSGNAENKRVFENSIFLKVDSVEPVYYADCFTLRASALKGVKVWINGDGHFFDCDDFTVCDPDVVREAGRCQAFSLFKELYDMPPSERLKVFGTMTMADLISKETYDDLTKKLDAWKKEKEEIRVRDEVYNINNGMRIVVTVPPYMGSNSCYYFSGIRKDGKVYRDEMVNAYKKTGLHVDDLDAYLEV